MHCETESAGGARRCSLVGAIRDHEGRPRFHENPVILREVTNLGRLLYLVRFDDAATTFVFPDEIRQ
jgi:hypothetical protein